MKTLLNQEARAKAAQLLLLRRNARRSLADWAILNGFEPAAHHRLLIDNLEAVTRGEVRRLMFLLPPGSAKSTYTSVLFPPWYLAQQERRTILACSYAYTLIEGFGRRCRNIIKQQAEVLKYDLAKDSQAAGDWETTNGGRYFCAGVGAGIAGHRADLAFLDDYIGSQEDADSKLIREKQWAWFWNDLMPRLHPGAALIIIANRRHEDDLVGRLLQTEGERWRVVRLPMLAEQNDPLGRPPGALLWPEWFTQEMVETAKKQTRTWAGLYQQRPAPEEGDYFKRDWLVGYEPGQLPKDLRIYGAGDFGVSVEKGANRTCFGLGGLDASGILWILPQIYWDYLRPDPPDKKIDGIIDLCVERPPLVVWGEKGHISKALKPFMQARMRERREYVYFEEVTPVHDKETRAQSFRARCAQGMVRFPKFAPWWEAAEHEMLTFPGGTFDDFVDMVGHLGRGIHNMIRPVLNVEKPTITELPPTNLTVQWMKDANRRQIRLERAETFADN